MTNSRLRRHALALPVALLVTGALAASASAMSTVSFEGDTLVVTGTAGVEGIIVSLDRDETSVRISDSGPGVTGPADRCDLRDGTYVVCPRPAALRVDTGAGDDSATIFDDLGVPGLVQLDGGEGNDDLQGYKGSEAINGGPGDDKVRGLAGNDALDGGDGQDIVDGGAGEDQVLGGAGNDILTASDDGAQARDVVDGGPGVDQLGSDYLQRTDANTSPVNLTLAGGADDGRLSGAEGDDVRSVERVALNIAGTYAGTDGADEIVVRQVLGAVTIRGLAGDDTLKSADGPDVVDGGDGSDTLDGGFGDDLITGGPGKDRIFGDTATGDCGPFWCKTPYGNDTIRARDGEADSITCGAGTDTVEADPADVVDADCETVDRAAVTSPSPACPKPPCVAKPPAVKPKLKLTVLATTLRDVRRGGLRIKVTVPGAGTVRATARRGAVIVGRQDAKTTTARTLTLRVAPRPAARRLRHGARLRVTVSYTPRGGRPVSVTASRTIR